MSRIKWDQVGERKFETGVDHGVLYLPDGSGSYVDGVAWNGLTALTESPSGAEASPQYADNIKYLNLISIEEFGGTIEAFTYPDEFEGCDGTATLAPGVKAGQQGRRSFGLSYRTLVGNDVDGTDAGFKIHLVYGALASPSERARNTVNDSPEASALSWEFTTSAVEIPGVDANGKPFKPTAHLTIDSTDPDVDADTLNDFLTVLYGSDNGADGRLPLPEEVIAFFSGSVVEVTPALPTYDNTSKVITIPTSTNTIYKIDGNVVPAGPRPALTTGQTKLVQMQPKPGFSFPDNFDDDRSFSF